MNYASCDMPRRTAPIVLGIVLALNGVAAAQPALPLSQPALPASQPTPALPVSKGGNGQETKPKENGHALPKLNIGECIRLAMEKQPKLHALRASLSSAQLGQRGLNDARFIGQLSPDYKYRRQQAANGVMAAAAELEQAEHDVTQAVVWTYFSTVYAREQVKVAKDAVDFVDYYRDQVDKIVTDKKGGTKEINQITLNELIIRLSEGKRLLIKARAGEQKAHAALKEAMGVDAEFEFEVAESKLPDFGKFELNKDVVVAHARTRRGEVIMAGLAAEVTQIEAYVQWSIKFRFRADTFASGADIHSRPLPSGMRNGEYRPDVVGPEMPPRLVGNRQTRYARAWELALRSQAVHEKVQNLVTLEGENAFIEYDAAGQTMIEAKTEVERADQNYKTLREVAGDKVSKSADLRNMLEAYASLAKAQGALNEAVYHRLTSLAAVERITAGGVKINYPNR